MQLKTAFSTQFMDGQRCFGVQSPAQDHTRIIHLLISSHPIGEWRETVDLKIKLPDFVCNLHYGMYLSVRLDTKLSIRLCTLCQSWIVHRATNDYPCIQPLWTLRLVCVYDCRTDFRFLNGVIYTCGWQLGEFFSETELRTAYQSLE